MYGLVSKGFLRWTRTVGGISRIKRFLGSFIEKIAVRCAKPGVRVGRTKLNWRRKSGRNQTEIIVSKGGWLNVSTVDAFLTFLCDPFDFRKF